MQSEKRFEVGCPFVRQTSKHLTFKEFEVARCIYGLLKHHKAKWYYIRRSWLKEALEKYHGITISLSALDKTLARLRLRGVLRSQPRMITGDDGRPVFRPSVYMMTNKMEKLFQRLTRGMVKSQGLKFLRGMREWLWGKVQEETKKAESAQIFAKEKSLEPVRPEPPKKEKEPGARPDWLLEMERKYGSAGG